jgi:hypothetical protein
MRIAAAYGLLFVILSGWIGSYWRCGEATYRLRLLHRMNAHEAAVSQQLEQWLTGFKLVKVVDSADFPVRGYFYSGDAVFSMEMEGDTVHFFLVDEAKAINYEPEYQRPDHASDNNPPLINLNDFFKYYLLPKTTLSAFVPKQISERLYASTVMYCSPFIAVPEPPPDYSC